MSGDLTLALAALGGVVLVGVEDVAVIGTWVAEAHAGGVEVVDAVTGARRSVG